MQTLLMLLLLGTAIFLILIILVQRGKGGGLAGAFGGLGGQSAFGTKAGDLFTRITIGVAAFWIVLCVFSIAYLGGGEGKLAPGMGAGAQQQQGASQPASQQAPAQGEPGGAGGGRGQPTAPEGGGGPSKPESGS